MFDWLWSKVIVMMAAVLFLSSIAAYFVSQKEYSQAEELENLACKLASFIDDTMDIPGTAIFLVGYDKEANFAIPKEIGGSMYSLVLRQDSVTVVHPTGTTVGYWTGLLHFWHWNGGPLDTSQLRSLDAAHPSLDVHSSQSFRISLELVTYRGSSVLLSFAEL